MSGWITPPHETIRTKYPPIFRLLCLQPSLSGGWGSELCFPAPSLRLTTRLGSGIPRSDPNLCLQCSLDKWFPFYTPLFTFLNLCLQKAWTLGSKIPSVCGAWHHGALWGTRGTDLGVCSPWPCCGMLETCSCVGHLCWTQQLYAEGAFGIWGQAGGEGLQKEGWSCSASPATQPRVAPLLGRSRGVRSTAQGGQGCPGCLSPSVVRLRALSILNCSHCVLYSA